VDLLVAAADAYTVPPSGLYASPWNSEAGACM